MSDVACLDSPNSPENYINHYACSPVSVLRKAHTPTILLLIEEEDGQVLPEQGRMLYRGLRKDKVQVQKNICKGEKHGLNWTVPGLRGVFKERRYKLLGEACRFELNHKSNLSRRRGFWHTIMVNVLVMNVICAGHVNSIRYVK
jgi:hypothetical protein